MIKTKEIIDNFLDLFASEDEFPAFKLNFWDGIILILIFLFSFTIHYILLSQSSYANGTDGYVYLIQVRSIIEEGRMHFKDVSLIYPYLVLITLVIKNYILSLKIGIAILTGLFSIAAYLLSISLTGKRPVGAAITAFTIFSPTLSFLAIQFPKNFLALLFFFFLIYFGIRRKFILAILFLLFTLITHRLMMGIVIIYFAISIFSSKKYKFILISTAILSFILILISFILPGTLHIFDFTRFSGLFSGYPQLAPYSFINLLGYNRVPNPWQIELYISLAIIISSSAYIIYRKIKKEPVSSIYIIFTLITLFLIFPFYTITMVGIGYRFYLISIPFTLVLVIQFLKDLNPRILSGITLLLLGSAIIFSKFKIAQFDPPYSLYVKFSQRIEDFIKEKDCDLLVAHKPFAELIDYSLRMEVLPWKPEQHLSRKKIWRVAKDIEIFEIESLTADKLNKFPDHLISRISAHYLIIREDLWDLFLNEVKNNGTDELKERVFSQSNPYVERPRYLTRSK